MRNTMFIQVLIVSVIASCACIADAAEMPDANKPLVQIAILLDTSNSMDGLIDQARTELWSIVNEFIFAEQGGRRPEVQVALYEYGNTRLSAETGWIRQVMPLTTDLKTSGGQEYCGRVIREATEKLAWSDSPNDLKVIFIAGNEPFTQGNVDYRQSCKAAVTRGIIVNTIHCGSEQQGIDGMWKDGAVLADGRYLIIDQNRQIVHIPAPQDTEIAELGVKLNATYIPYGAQGHIAQERQTAQDNNASHASMQAVVQRALAKSSVNYVNSTWDLVDAVQNKSVDLNKIESEDLPANMQSMNTDEKVAYVNARAAERTQLQARIQQLNEQRNKYVAEQAAKQPQADTLGAAVKQAVREQAQKKNYTFKPADNPSGTPESSAEKK
jgi:hypothetical protein